MSLYGSYVKDSNQKRHVYEHIEESNGKIKVKVVSVNHVTHNPKDASDLFTKDKKKHTEYVTLGRYLGPDTKRLFDKLERSKTSTSTTTTRSFPKRK